MIIRALPSLTYLNECFMVDATAPGGLRWKVRPRKHFATERGWLVTNSRFAEHPAGCLRASKRTGHTYIVRIDYETYFNHRIVYSICNNEDLSVDVQIDHRDGNRENNSPDNLRKVNQTQNLCNRGKTKANTSGHKCVFWCKIMSAWYGKVVVNKVSHRTEYSSNIKEIVEKVKTLRETLHKEFAHHG